MILRAALMARAVAMPCGTALAVGQSVAPRFADQRAVVVAMQRLAQVNQCKSDEECGAGYVCCKVGLGAGCTPK